MKYYIEYPIPIVCGLKCPYCFHAEAWEGEHDGTRYDKYPLVCPFTPQQFLTWRDRHLTNATEFLYELHGGEPSDSRCQPAVFEAIDTFDKGKFQIQSNGLGTTEFYSELIKRNNKINRIGFTFHRAVIGAKKELVDRFVSNVLSMQDCGIQIYVKELLVVEHRAAILENKETWEGRGVEFRIQEFKGYKGRDGYPLSQYTADDWKLVYPEYCHNKDNCQCRIGYKQVLIRGYDIFAGDVIACWNDPTVVGNIVEDWYDGGYIVNTGDYLAGRDVQGVKKLYRGGWPRDIWVAGVEDRHGSSWHSKDKNNLQAFKQYTKKRSFKMKQWLLQQVDELTRTFHTVNNNIQLYSQEVAKLTVQAHELKGKIDGFQMAIQEYDSDEKENDVNESQST